MPDNCISLQLKIKDIIVDIGKSKGIPPNQQNSDPFENTQQGSGKVDKQIPDPVRTDEQKDSSIGSRNVGSLDQGGKLGRKRGFTGGKLNFESIPKKTLSESELLVDQIKNAIYAADVSKVTCEVIQTNDKRSGFNVYPISGNNVNLYAHMFPRTAEQVESFWSTLEAQGIDKVIKLAKGEACAEYLPNSAIKSSNSQSDEGARENVQGDNKKQMKSGIEVEVLSRTALLDLDNDIDNANTVELEMAFNNKKRIVHVDQIFVWPDHGTVTSDVATKILKRVPNENCVIHCYAGLGRTGTLIVLKQLSNDTNLTKENLIAKMAYLIARGRIQRTDHRYVQTDDQIKFIYDYAVQNLLKK